MYTIIFSKSSTVYKGLINVWWEIMTSTDGDRTHKLTFHRRGLEIVTGSYIMWWKKGKNRGQEQEDEAIHQ